MLIMIAHLPAIMMAIASPFNHGLSAWSEFCLTDASISHCETSGFSTFICEFHTAISLMA